jgi:NAD(P)-dependent dehydrogenase (short-subunit alcohol dehydrogenase family)
MQQTSTNVIAPYVLTRALMPLLFASPTRRIIFVSSEMGSIADMQSELEESRRPPAGWPKAPHFSFPSYRASKAAVNMIAADWRHELANDNFTIHSLCPGFVATNLGGLGPEVLRSWGAGDAADSGRFIRDVAHGKRDEDQMHMIKASGIIPY